MIRAAVLAVILILSTASTARAAATPAVTLGQAQPEVSDARAMGKKVGMVVMIGAGVVWVGGKIFGGKSKTSDGK